MEMHDHQKKVRSALHDQLPDGPSLTAIVGYGLERRFWEAREDCNLLGFVEREAIALPSSIQLGQHHLRLDRAFRHHKDIDIMFGGQASNAFL